MDGRTAARLCDELELDGIDAASLLVVVRKLIERIHVLVTKLHVPRPPAP